MGCFFEKYLKKILESTSRISPPSLSSVFSEGNVTRVPFLAITSGGPNYSRIFLGMVFPDSIWSIFSHSSVRSYSTEPQTQPPAGSSAINARTASLFMRDLDVMEVPALIGECALRRGFNPFSIRKTFEDFEEIPARHFGGQPDVFLEIVPEENPGGITDGVCCDFLAGFNVYQL